MFLVLLSCAAFVLAGALVLIFVLHVFLLLLLLLLFMFLLLLLLLLLLLSSPSFFISLSLLFAESSVERPWLAVGINVIPITRIDRLYFDQPQKEDL